MTAKYFFGNTLASFFRTNSGVIEDTTASRFNSSFVANGIKIIGSADYIETMPFIDAASTTTLWTHFELYYQSGSGTAGTATWMWVNSSGTPVFRILGTSNGTLVTLQAAYWNGSSFTNIGSTYALAVSTLHRIDVKLTAGVSGTFDMYVAGTNVLTGSGMNAAVTNFAKVRLYGITQSSTCWYSQILGADFDTRDSRYYCQLPAALGSLTDGSGAASDVGETALDESTALALSTVGHRRSYTHSSFTLPSGYQVVAACVASRARVSGAGPTDGKVGLRKITAGVNYSSSALALAGGYEPRGRYWDTDPGLGGLWTAAGWNDAEMFMEAA